MIFFRAPEFRRRFDLRYHWPAKTPAHIDLFPGCFRRRLLLGRMIKITERYCVPTSGPCLFNVVGLWFDQKTSKSWSYVVCDGSNSTSTASAWPVLSVQTSS